MKPGEATRVQGFAFGSKKILSPPSGQRSLAYVQPPKKRMLDRKRHTNGDKFRLRLGEGFFI